MIYRPKRWSLTKGVPAVEPVGLALLKQEARIDSDAEDIVLEGCIAAARAHVEAFTNRALIAQAWVLKISEFPASETALIELPGGTLQSVSTITYLDVDGASQTWAASNYVVDKGRAPGRVGLAYDKDWPVVREWDLPVTITYSVGFGATGASVPPNLLQAVKHMAAFLYDNRGSEDVAMPRAVRMMASRWRVPPAVLGRE